MFRDNPNCVFLLLAGLTDPGPHTGTPTLRPLTGSRRTKPPHMAHGSDPGTNMFHYSLIVLYIDGPESWTAYGTGEKRG